MQLGQRLKQARLSKGITQEQLGDALGGLTGPTISAIEKGTAKTFRDPALVVKAAQILGVSPIWLQFGLGEEELINEAIPLIDWDDITKPSARRNVLRRIGTTVAVSPKSFALTVSGNSMVAPSGNEVSFREGMVIIVDPEAEVKPNSFVIASNGDSPMLRKLVKDGHKQFLQPLNPLFQQEEAGKKCKVIGVVRSLLQEEFA